MAKRPENMTSEERLTRIRSLERKVAQLERDKAWAEREMECATRWGQNAWDEIRRLQEVCTRHWNEKNQYRVAAGLDPVEKWRPIAVYDHDAGKWVALKDDCPSADPEDSRSVPD